MKNEVKFGKHLGIDFSTFWWMLGGKLKEKGKSNQEQSKNSIGKTLKTQRKTRWQKKSK